MIIRKVTIADTEQLEKLINNFDNQNETYLTPQQIKYRVYKDLQKTIKNTANEYINDPKYIVYVADDNGQLKGYIAGVINNKEERKYDKEGYLQDWYIEQDVQHLGIGKLLLNTLMQQFEDSECTHVSLYTHVDNAKSIQIYEHLGFTKRHITFFKPLKNIE